MVLRRKRKLRRLWRCLWRFYETCAVATSVTLGGNIPRTPRITLSPTIVSDKDNNLQLVVGSPGGSRIINYVAQTIINVLDFKLDIQAAINHPRMTNRNDVTSLEKGTDIVTLKPALEAKGHKVRIVDLNSGLHGIQISDGKIMGGADPRRESVAVGQ